MFLLTSNFCLLQMLGLCMQNDNWRARRRNCLTYLSFSLSSTPFNSSCIFCSVFAILFVSFVLYLICAAITNILNFVFTRSHYTFSLVCMKRIQIVSTYMYSFHSHTIASFHSSQLKCFSLWMVLKFARPRIYKVLYIMNSVRIHSEVAVGFID